MSNCDCHENIKELIEHRPISTTAEEHDGLIQTTVATMAARMFFGLRAMGLGQPYIINE